MICILRDSINNSTLIILGIPGTPSDLTVIEVTATSVALSWTPPHDRGGGNIIGYHVKDTVANTELTAKFEDNSIIVDHLEQNTTYKFRVAAENEAGVGPYSDEVEGTTKVSVILSDCNGWIIVTCCYSSSQLTL